MSSVQCSSLCQDFEEKCRACLNSIEKSNCFPLPLHLYFYCTELQVKNGDGLPGMMCQNCFELLNKFYYFKQQCVRSEAILREKIKPTYQTSLDTAEILKNDLKNAENNYCTDKNIVKISSPTNLENSEITLNNIKDCDNNVDCKINIIRNDCSIKISESNHKTILLEKEKKTRRKITKQSNKMLNCQKCDKSFFKYVKLEAHMRKHFGMKPDSTVKCDQCDKKFTTEKNLKSHMRVHTGEKKYKCKTCEKAFGYLNVLKNHERAHAGIKKYVCQHCEKKFVQLTNLNTHLLMHTGEKPYFCEPCNRRFGQPSEYKLHMLRHTGVKKFACDLCSLRFYTNAHLQKHMGTHSDIRPYACKMCDKRFKTRSYMTVHNRTHTGERPFSCDYCPMKFISGKDKRTHQRTHTGEKSPSKKAKFTNPEMVKSIEKSKHDSGESICIGSNVDRPPAISVPIGNFYLLQDVHTVPLAKSDLEQNCSYDSTKPNDKQLENDFFHVPSGIEKSQCSFINSMY